MFIVFSKEKISSYTLIIAIVIMLFGVAFSMKDKNAIETSSNVEENVQEKNEYMNASNVMED